MKSDIPKHIKTNSSNEIRITKTKQRIIRQLKSEMQKTTKHMSSNEIRNSQT